ncbi:MAG: sel1 repeat family protein [Ectothiorhodospiraceae bacterium]|nr:sel1 repeat family protein [Ectothiorhodospiraceae bacterium]
MSNDVTQKLTRLLGQRQIDNEESGSSAGAPTAGRPGTGCYQMETSARRDDRQQLAHLRQRAAAGDPEASLALGNRYRRGEGVPVDLLAAWNHYVTAARGGNLEAMTNIGVMHDQGQTVPPDPVKACQCYRYAAERGFAVAQYNLAIMYAEGLGVERDPELALHWFGAAAAQGYAPAAEAYDWLSAQQESI